MTRPGSPDVRARFARLICKWQLGEPVVIVSGLPRSGTSMVMKMLQAGGYPLMTDQARRADEDNPEGYYEYERVKDLASETDKSWVREARGKALKVISHLVKELPPDNFYRIVFARRDLKEVLASQNIMLARRLQPNPIEDAEAEQLYRKHLLSIMMHIQSRPNMELLTVNYHEIVRDPVRCAGQISRFLAGKRKPDPETMARAVDARLYRNRNRQPAT